MSGQRVTPEAIEPGMRLWCSAFTRADDYLEVVHVGRGVFIGNDPGGFEDVWLRDEYEWTLVGRAPLVHSARKVAPGQHVIERAGHEVACFTAAVRIEHEATVVRALCLAMDREAAA